MSGLVVTSGLLLAAFMGTPSFLLDASNPATSTQTEVNPDESGRVRRIEALIDTGKLDAAKTALNAEELSPLARASLQGRLALANQQPLRASEFFATAIELAPEHLPLRLLYAHALLRAGRFEAVEKSLAPPRFRSTDPGVSLLRAAAMEATQRPNKAYEILVSASLAHPNDLPVRRELALLCARQGMLKTASDWAASMRPHELTAPVAVVMLQEIRGKSGALQLAQWLASAFTHDANVQTQLGWVASAAGNLRTASHAFQKAVRLGANEAYTAAEHARARRKYRDALRMNLRVTDPKTRAEQRFDILFESGELAHAITAATMLERRHGLSARRRYNLAYAHYALKQYAEASTQARKLSDTPQAQRAQSLLRAMGRE